MSNDSAESTRQMLQRVHEMRTELPIDERARWLQRDLERKDLEEYSEEHQEFMQEEFKQLSEDIKPLIEWAKRFQDAK